MTENEALALFKCLADKSRLQILKSLSREDMYVERLAERLGLTAPTVSFHLKKLSDVGAVRSYKTQYYTMYALQEETLRPSMLSLIQADSSEAALQAQRDEAYRQKVLSSFLEQLGVSPKTAREDACKIEHDISEETFAVIRDHLRT